MKSFKKNFWRLIKLTASLKFAVITMIAIAVLTAIGTFIEAEYNADVAKKLVYQSFAMYTCLIVLCLTLIAVMIDRWPWQRHHLGFVLAHVGIILLLIGAWLTQKFGIDGNMRIEPGENQKYVTTPDTRVVVYASYDGDSYRSVFTKDVDFYMDRPEQNPLKVTLGNEVMEVVEYMPFAVPQSKIIESKVSTDPPAIRFQLENQRINTSQWLLHRGRGDFTAADLGPAQVLISRKPLQPTGRNEILVWPEPKSGGLEYAVYSKEQKKIKSGIIKRGGSVDTGWMGLVFRILDYYPSAREQVSFQALERPTSISTSAIKVVFQGETHWVGLNSVLKLFNQTVGYVLAYQNKLIDVGFDIRLEQFQVGRYQGTMRAASYQSRVSVPGLGEQVISMNEPLKHNGFTFYQASFEEDAMGKPVATVLSVNRDPGLGLKYLGSILIVVGTIVMFYFKRRKTTGTKKAEGVAA